MPKFVIERDVPGAGNLTDAQWREISQKSANVLGGANGLQHQACWEDARAEGRGSGLGGLSGSPGSPMLRRSLPSCSAIGPVESSV
jgi:hypothetical protein